MRQLDKKQVLNSSGQKVWEKIKRFRNPGILAGGTALALQLGHRRSIDFDFFRSEEIKKSLLTEVKRIFDKIQILINNTDELTFLTSEKVKITFFYYPFKFRFKPKLISGIKVLDIRDIAFSKAATLNRRAAIKDYVDLYFILKSGLSIGTIIKNAELIYDDLFAEKLFLAQLLYTKDIDKSDLDKIYFLPDKKVSFKMMEKYFKEIIKERLPS